MSQIASDVRYTKTHEWVRIEDDHKLTVGISDHAQSLLGDVVFVELPEVDCDYGEEAEIAVIESVKAASDVYNPVAGRVVDVNSALAEQPDLVNTTPYESGWLYQLFVDDTQAVFESEVLMNAEEYQSMIAEEDQ